MGFDMTEFSALRSKKRKEEEKTSAPISDFSSFASELSGLRDKRVEEEQKALDAKLSPRERKLKAQEKRLDENYGATQSNFFKAATAEQTALQNAGGSLTSLDQIGKDSSGFSFADYGELLNYSSWLSDTDRRAYYNLNKERSGALQKEIDSLTKKAKTQWSKLTYEQKVELIDKNRAANGKNSVSFVESLALSDKDKQALSVLMSTKSGLDKANSNYDKYGNAAGLSNEEIEKLKDAAYEKGDTEAYFYYDSLKGKKEMWDTLGVLYDTKMSGKSTSIAEEAIKVAGLPEGEAKEKQIEDLKKEFKKAGVDFDTYYALIVGEEAGLEFFKESEGNALEATGATVADAAMSFGRGVGNFGEGVLDTVGYGIANVADLFGDEFAGKARIVAGTDYVNNWLTSDTIQRYSVLGRTSRSILEGTGQVAAMIGLSYLGGAAGLAPGAASTLTTGTLAASSVGSATGEAFKSGASVEEATAYGLMSGAVETMSEMLFQGLGKGLNIKGLSSLDDIVASKISSVFKKPAMKNIVQYAIKSGAEGFEEVIAGFGNAVAKKLTYMNEEDIEKLLEDESLFESFVVGSFTSSIAQGKDLVKSVKSGKDFVSGLTKTEKTALDGLLKKRVEEAEKDGEKIDSKEKAKLYDDLVEAMDRGELSINEIEEVLGEDAKKKLDELSEKEAKDKAEFAEHYEGEELKKRIEEYDAASERAKLESELSNEVFEKVKDTRLAETYREQYRVGQTFTVNEEDLKKMDSKRADAYRRAMEDGIVSNTRKAHDLVDITSKIEAEKGVRIDLYDTKKLAEMGFNPKDVFVNGVTHKGGVAINVQSKKALNSIVGHELLHVLRGNQKQYETLRDVAIELAKVRGEYDSRWKQIDSLYKNKDGYKGDVEKIKEELVADLVGDYLFSDPEFIRNLSVKDRNLFQRIWDEVKYLFNIATAGSAEARQLEKLKKTFEDAYRAETKGVTETKYSISDPKTDSDGKQLTEGQREYFNESKIRDNEGNLKVMYHGSSKTFSVFDRKKARSGGTYGRGFYFTDSTSHAKQYGETYEVYLNIKNPLQNGTNNITKEHLRKFVEVLAEDEDYGLDNYGYDATVDSVVDSVYGKSDFAMLLDLNASCVGDMVNAVEIFNRVNGTTYDGIVAPTETVAFYPEQIKSVDNKNPTKNPDIRYSLSENGDTPKKYGDLNITGEDVRLQTAEAAPEEISTVRKTPVPPRSGAEAVGLPYDSRYGENIARMVEEQLGISPAEPADATSAEEANPKPVAEPVKEKKAPVRKPPKKIPGTTISIAPEDGNTEVPPVDGEERSWIPTSSESDAVNGFVKPEDIPDEFRYYQPLSNKTVLESANDRLNSDGYDESLAGFKQKMKDSSVSVEDIVLGERLLQEAVKKGDFKTSTELMVDIAVLGTELGRMVQALSIIKRLSPEGQLMALTRIVERGKRNKKTKKIFKDVEVTPEIQELINSVKNEDGTYDQEKLNEVMEEAKQKIADQMGVTAMERLDAWRYFAMLGNLKTHIRNGVSNGANFAMRIGKNAVQRTVEGLALRDAVAKEKQRAAQVQKNKPAELRIDSPVKQSGIIPNGTAVKAKDRNNFGKVVGYDSKTNKYAVYFEGANGVNKTVKLDSNLIEPIVRTKKKTAKGEEGENLGPVHVRTRTWARPSSVVKEFAKKITMEEADTIAGSGYSDLQDIKQKRKMFPGIIQKAYKFNMDALEVEDSWFSRPTYRLALAEYLTANGIRTQEDIDNNKDLVAKAKAFALDEALTATFRQDSALANWISSLENMNRFSKLAVGAVLPFKKTPINIAKAGVSYSPIGFAKGLVDVVRSAKSKGESVDMTKAIDEVAQGLTGSALAMLGLGLASMGILKGAGEEDKEAKYDYQLGEQSYSIKIGDDTFSLSWLTPVSMPLFVGANVYESIVEDQEMDWNVAADALLKTLDPLTELSFISGLTDTISSYRGSSSGIVGGMFASAFSSYVTQYFPTLFSQIGQFFDDTKRNTKPSKDSSFSAFEEFTNKVAYKVPLWRNSLEPTTDIWGNEVKQATGVEGFAQAFVHPWNPKYDISTDIDDEIKDLYNQTGENSVLPKIPDNYTNYEGVKYEMSAAEHTEYKKTYGQTAYDMLSKLFKTDTYKNGDKTLRQDMVEAVYEYAGETAKVQFFKGRDLNYTNAKDDNGNKIYKENAILGAVKHDMTLDEYRFYEKYPKKYKFFEGSGLSYKAYEAANEDEKRGYSWAYDNQEKYEASKLVTEDFEEFYTYKAALNKISAGNQTKAQKAAYISGLDLDAAGKMILFRMEYPNDDTYNRQIVSYVNASGLTYSEKVKVLNGLGISVGANGAISW